MGRPANDTAKLSPGLRQDILDLGVRAGRSELHNEIFRMIKYAVEEMVTAGDQASRLLEFWTAIVERLFGLPLRDAQARARPWTLELFASSLP